MKRILIASFSLLIGIFLVTQVSAQSVNGSLKPARKGGVTSGSIVISIPKGLHINSSNPRSKYAVPTSVSVSAPGAKAYSVRYPRGKVRTFPFSKVPISVYEGRAVINFKVRVPKNFRGKVLRVRAKIRYQACTDEVCYAPKTKNITLSTRVR